MNTASRLVPSMAVAVVVAAAVAIGTGMVGLPGGPADQAASDAVTVASGLSDSQDGYTLAVAASTHPVGEPAPFAFTITGPAGEPVTEFTPTHEKDLHLIVVRRDTTGFQHLHPERDGAGRWSVPLRLDAAGPYKVYADFAPGGQDGAIILATDLTAPGQYEPQPLPSASRTHTVDGYAVELDGDLVPGTDSALTFTVSKDGQGVDDLEPYLGAYGHLVALRASDLAYLHVHPDGEPGDGRTAAGPGITLYAEVPSAGDYRLYLQFQRGGAVRTAEFSASTTASAAAPG